ncbi:3-hydroxyacyl-CoA dehydrogenase NAD-binding domain-containing protein, partial [Pseudomonas sp. SIMBA_067]|uniref:3-hydroxyacyl-CoA dehydrogenase NAD-binding domain-containing protein n=1 Tax=Pseudomonas sp. SIMBA_067 TaxID=3085807 RepID=UPI00397ACA1E
MQYRGTKSIQRVAVIGAGVIGAGWAAAYLARVFEVTAYDPSAAMQERASTQISRAGSAMLELD